MGGGSLREPSFSSRRGTATIVVLNLVAYQEKTAFPEQRLSLSWVLEDLEESLPGAWDNVLPHTHTHTHTQELLLSDSGQAVFLLPSLGSLVALPGSCLQSFAGSP